MLRVYNSLSGQKETFKPLRAGHVGLYVCGITVYDHCHIGHARMFLVFDMVARYLQASGLNVRYVRNITDVDDKIIKRAAERGESIYTLTERYIRSMKEDTDALNMLSPTHEPRATQYIQSMIDLITRLIDKQAAYHVPGQDVFFKVRSFAGYGDLSKRNIEELQIGARVEANQAKEDPLDFVLWKRVPTDEPHWPSPWGPGRPGWHIECSAMSLDCLGASFDIHGGGPDLKFPHHENERAQSESASGQRFVQIWMHTGFLQRDAEKMSKSADNFLTIKDFLAHYQPEVLRYFMLSSHYRSPIEYSLEHIDTAKSALHRLYTALKEVSLVGAIDVSYQQRFDEAMQDDFNTPMALSVLFDLSHALNRAKVEQRTGEAINLAYTLRQLGAILGVLQEDPSKYLQTGGLTFKSSGLLDADIEDLIRVRLDARAARDWSKADSIRQQLLESGIMLEDDVNGTTWRR